MAVKREFWQGHVNAWRASGRTQSGYCREHQLALASFGYWRRKLEAAKGSAVQGVIPIVPAGLSGSAPIEIALRNGLTMRVPMTLDPARVVAWVKVLGTC